MLKFWSDKFKKFVNKLISKRANIILKIQSQLDVDLRPQYKIYERNKTTQCTIWGATCIQRIVSKYMYFSEKIYFLPDCYSTLAHSRSQSHTVGHHRTWSDMVEHHRTNILLKNCRTRSHKNWCLSHTVAHSRTDDRARSNTVAQTTAHSRTRSHRKPHTVAQKILSYQNGLPSPLWPSVTPIRWVSILCTLQSVLTILLVGSADSCSIPPSAVAPSMFDTSKCELELSGCWLVWRDQARCLWYLQRCITLNKEPNKIYVDNMVLLVLSTSLWSNNWRGQCKKQPQGW